MLYGHVQRKYWGSLGPFTYWEMKQLPNFILALPCFVLVAHVVSAEIRQQPRTYKALGLLSPPLPVAQALRLAMVFGLSALAIFAAIFMNIQVTTRLLFSSTPLLYI